MAVPIRGGGDGVKSLPLRILFPIKLEGGGGGGGSASLGSALNPSLGDGEVTRATPLKPPLEVVMCDFQRMQDMMDWIKSYTKDEDLCIKE